MIYDKYSVYIAMLKSWLNNCSYMRKSIDELCQFSNEECVFNAKELRALQALSYRSKLIEVQLVNKKHFVEL